MLKKIFHALTDPNSFWREIIRYGLLAKYRTPRDWFLFRHEVARECAMRREPQGGPVKKYVEDIFPEMTNIMCLMNNKRPMCLVLLRVCRKPGLTLY